MPKKIIPNSRDMVGEAIQARLAREDARRAAASQMLRALRELMAADDAMVAFLLAADPKKIGEEEWDAQHRERGARKRKAINEARAAIAAAEAAGIEEA